MQFFFLYLSWWKLASHTHSLYTEHHIGLLILELGVFYIYSVLINNFLNLPEKGPTDVDDATAPAGKWKI